MSGYSRDRSSSTSKSRLAELTNQYSQPTVDTQTDETALSLINSSRILSMDDTNALPTRARTLAGIDSRKQGCTCHQCSKTCMLHRSTEFLFASLSYWTVSATSSSINKLAAEPVVPADPVPAEPAEQTEGSCQLQQH